MRLTRREGLALVGSMAAACSVDLARGRAAREPIGLHALAAQKGLRFGSCLAWSATGADRGSFGNPAYARLLTRDCGLLVADNEMKWQAIRPAVDQFDFAKVDAIVAWAGTNGMAVRGHNLLWHQTKWMPNWLNAHDFGTNPSTSGAAILVQHIETFCHRYGTRIDSYDVVNEAVDPANGSLYETALSKAIGGAQATIDLAFRTARHAAPHAELVYNDFMSWEPHNERHREGVLRLLEGFRARNVPVDALGVQSHIITQGPGVDGGARSLEREWRQFLDRVTEMGFRLVVTELDVRDDNLPIETAKRDVAVAAFTRAYLDVMLSYQQLRDILVWGLSDRYSWIEKFDPRKDGALRRPCPYDRQFSAKPMHEAIAAALRAATLRKAALATT